MVGLRTQESTEFEKFFELVQAKANEEECTYFLDSEDGNEATIQNMELCDLWGWKIPKDKIEEFKPIWENDEVDDDWIDYFVAVEWQVINKKIEIDFVDYQYYIKV